MYVLAESQSRTGPFYLAMNDNFQNIDLQNWTWSEAKIKVTNFSRGGMLETKSEETYMQKLCIHRQLYCKIFFQNLV